MERIGRAEATRLGLTRYFTGKPCIAGHISERYTKGGCVLCGSRFYSNWVGKNRRKRQAIDAQWYARNRNTKMRRSMAWARANPERLRHKESRRRSRKNAGLNTFTADDWDALRRSSSACHWCKRKFTHKRRATHDHVVPLAKGGANTLENSCCACSECNTRKGDRLINPVTGQGILL